ncbi:hypothetical protein EJB05_10327, partial [Eragrostis curvula]
MTMPKGQDKVIRRLTVDLRDKEVEMTVMANNRHLSQVRSLSIFGGNCRIPDLMEFKFMRVLFLDVSSLKTTTDLTGINHLSQLTYLRVKGRYGTKVLLPAQIRGLRFLETLDLSELSLFEGLTEIADVPCLSHVSVNWTERVRLPDGINKVKSLLTLRYFDLGMSSTESVTGLGELTALSELFLHYNNGGIVAGNVVSLIAALVTSLKKLGNLKNLWLQNYSSKVYSGDALLESSFSPPFCNIEVLYPRLLIFSSFPRWIGHLRCLRELRLHVKQMHQEDFDIIGIKLTSLFVLNLRVVRIPTERIMIGGSTGFKVLRRFMFDCDGVSCLTFEAGAMPDLQQLILLFDPHEWDKATPVGLQHLPSLKNIQVIPMKLRSDTRPFEKKDAQMMKCVFQEAAGALPTGPAVEVKGFSVPRKEEAELTVSRASRAVVAGVGEAVLEAKRAPAVRHGLFGDLPRSSNRDDGDVLGVTLTLLMRSLRTGLLSWMVLTRVVICVQAVVLRRGMGMDVPETLGNKKVISIDVGLVLAGTKYREGEFEERLKSLLREVKRSGNVILFLDEVHTLVRAGAVEGGAMDAANILKPALAREIADVPCLSHFSVFCLQRARLPDGINKVKSLLTLSGFDLGMSSIENLTCLGELTALSELHLSFNGRTRDNDGGVVTLIAALVTSLKKLGNLKSLCLWNLPSNIYIGDVLLESSFSPPFYNIEQLRVSLLIFSSFLRWIGHLRCLRDLKLVVKQMHQEDFDIIGIKLTFLVLLHLRVARIPTERIMIGGSTGFKVLKWFMFDCDGVSCLTFEAGAMPDLWNLELCFDPREWDKATPVGLQHLLSLKTILVRAAKLRSDKRSFEGKDLEMMMDVFREAADALPTGPALCVDESPWPSSTTNAWTGQKKKNNARDLAVPRAQLNGGFMDIVALAQDAFRGSSSGGQKSIIARASFDRLVEQVMDVLALAQYEIQRLGYLTFGSRDYMLSMVSHYVSYFLFELIYREALTIFHSGVWIGTLKRCGTDLTKLAKEVIVIDMVGLLAGTVYRGQFETRIKNLLREVKRSGNVILFIDEVHTVVGAGQLTGNAIDVANIFKPALARGELQCIGATTTDEYKKHVEKDPALERRFGPVKIPEPTVEETTGILKGLRERYEKHHKVQYSDDSLCAAAELSDKYISDRFLPDKAIDLVDQAGSLVSLRHAQQKPPMNVEDLEAELNRVIKEKCDAVRWENYKRAKELRDRELQLKSLIHKSKEISKDEVNNPAGAVVTEEDIRHIVSTWTGVPVQKLSTDETNKLLNMEETLHKRVVGQEAAVTAISRAIRRARAGLNEPCRPIGSFIFAGPTGVGKTELAKALAAVYYGSEDAMVRFDMSEFMDKHTVSRLIGPPPGYREHEEGGQLTEAVRRRPHTVILFDEIEKAHPDVFNIMLQVLDDGRLTDGKGRTVDFTNTLIIMTSNIGGSVVVDGSGITYDKIKGLVAEEMKRHFRPEFLNRLDEVIVFKQLTKVEIKEIAAIMLNHVADRVRNKGIELQVTDDFKELVVEKGFDTSYGVRPLKRAIQRLLEDTLADKMLAGEIKAGDSVTVDVDSAGDVVISRHHEDEE